MKNHSFSAIVEVKTAKAEAKPAKTEAKQAKAEAKQAKAEAKPAKAEATNRSDRVEETEQRNRTEKNTLSKIATASLVAR